MDIDTATGDSGFIALCRRISIESVHEIFCALYRTSTRLLGVFSLRPAEEAFTFLDVE